MAKWFTSVVNASVWCPSWSTLTIGDVSSDEAEAIASRAVSRASSPDIGMPEFASAPMSSVADAVVATDAPTFFDIEAEEDDADDGCVSDILFICAVSFRRPFSGVSDAGSEHSDRGDDCTSEEGACHSEDSFIVSDSVNVERDGDDASSVSSVEYKPKRGRASAPIAASPRISR